MPLFTAPLPVPPIISNDAVAFSGTSSTAAVATTVYVYPFELHSAVTIVSARWRNGTANTPGHTSMAIYDSTGKLVTGSDTGAQSNVANTETTFNYGAAFTLAPGLYYMALACDNSTDQYLSNPLSAANVPITKSRKAANALSGGAMPSTLGALSGAAFSPAMAFLVSGGLS